MIPRSSSIGDPDHHRGPADEALSGIHGGQPVSQQRRLQQVPGPGRQRPPAIVAGVDLLDRLHALEADRHASSVFDASILTGPLTNAAVADSHNLDRDRDYSAGDIPHLLRRVDRVGSAGGRGPRQAAARHRRRARQRLERSGRDDAAVRHPDRGDPGEFTGVRGLRLLRGRISSAIRNCPPINGRRLTGSTPRRSPRPISSRSEPRPAIRCVGRRTAMSISRSCATSGSDRVARLSCEPRSSICLTR